MKIMSSLVHYVSAAAYNPAPCQKFITKIDFQNGRLGRLPVNSEPKTEKSPPGMSPINHARCTYSK